MNLYFDTNCIKNKILEKYLELGIFFIKDDNIFEK